MTTTTNASLAGKTIGEIEGRFFVPDYQRGYRWTEAQVRALLNDIKESQKTDNDGKYCLQPVVVRRRGEGDYELIDGQQRFTTILILLKYLERQGVRLKTKYSIDYETREKTTDFLANIDQQTAESNIDFHHIYHADRAIGDWFTENYPDENALYTAQDQMRDTLLQHVIVIWYEVGQEEDPIALFTRLNIGRIELTNAELIRALLLREDDKSNESNELATLWDVIEGQMRDNRDEMWYFMTRCAPARYPSRIELLFDMMAGKEANVREKYFTFFYFESQIRERGIEAVGKDIERAFLQIKEWYTDNVLYHKIGYLIAAGAETMAHLLSEFKDMRKSDIMSSLDKKIAKSITFSKDSYSDLDYEHNYAEISRLLLLFNVQSLIDSKASRQRFPFSMYNTSAWSLEHIHAQHSEGLRTNKIRHEWVALHLPSVKSVSPEGENVELIGKMQDIVDHPESELPQSTFSTLFDAVSRLLTADADTSYIHTIANMALLSRADNSALNNAAFDVKREKIIEMDKADAFIPYCTKMVFLKYYTPADDVQTHFWSAKDREAYVAQIGKTLKPYMDILNEELKKLNGKDFIKKTF